MELVRLMLSEWELWACANTVHRDHGPNAPAAIAERIETLARVHDTAGVATRRAIAERYARLMAAPGETTLRH